MSGNGPLMAHADQQDPSGTDCHVPACPLTWFFLVERVRGIEPPLSAWEADVLPLNYTRG
jgi:hypothetical protein